MKRKEPSARGAGILLPVFSLPSAYGIGAFSKEAFAFVDFLKDAGQSYWQMLPLNPTGYGDSPYQSFSSFAGNPFFIDIDDLVEEGLLSRREAAAQRKKNTGAVDYPSLHRSRKKLLQKAFLASGMTKELSAFIRKEKKWLTDYALFMALREAHGKKPWNTWEEPLRHRKKDALLSALAAYEDRVTFECFLQYLFYRQLGKLKHYANENGIRIIGDIPIYVAYDGADCWADQKLFLLDKDGLPVEVAGCPPDAYAKTGQLWGNPLYRWDVHEKEGFSWWKRRMEAVFRGADIVRIDHFRGFEGYYCIPYGDKTAENGVWRKGPGIRFFRAINETLNGREVIAEDLGFLTKDVLRLRDKSGFPGMKVLQFAFDESEASDYLPYRYPENCVVYTGTHDNQTTAAWVKELSRHDRMFAKRYFNVKSDKALTDAMIRGALSSVARIAVIPLQDYLGLGKEARTNTPSTVGCNWMWRMEESVMTEALAAGIRDLTKLYGRAPVRKERV